MELDELILGCRHEDSLAQAELYNLYSSKMLSVCYRYAACREDAEDMLQEGFIKIFANIHSFENKGSFEGWMRKIIINTCINVLKKNKKFNSFVMLEEASTIPFKEDSIASLIQSRQVIDYIRLLPVGYRTVLNLYAIEGYMHKEIAVMLDIEEGTSRSQYSKARNMLEQMLIKNKILERPDGHGALAFS